MRYYPQQQSNSSTASYHANKATSKAPSGEVHLNRRLILSFIISINKTSKLAVIRSRIRRRVSNALGSSLVSAGPSILPAQPMHMLFNLNLSCLTAPFSQLQSDTLGLYLAMKKSYDSNPGRGSQNRDLQGKQKQKQVPKNGHDLSAQLEIARIDQAKLDNRLSRIINQLPGSTYLKPHGGAHDLLTRMLEHAGSKVPDQLRNPIDCKA